DDATRQAALRLKLNPISEMFENKRVILVDDSIVRGNTMRRLVALVRSLGPRQIHLAIYSPPVQHPCFYGIDMPSTRELVAHGGTRVEVEERLAAHLGADSLTYLSLEGLHEVAGDAICAACFDGSYVVPVTQDEQNAINRDRRA
ncbi:MAG: phosphoribosyltransferase family protein, partial [Gemmatimonadota bacterium]|nr:phosphoribosyltransferase family protein [Gemmatimonadota bacterium]